MKIAIASTTPSTLVSYSSLMMQGAGRYTKEKMEALKENAVHIRSYRCYCCYCNYYHCNCCCLCYFYSCGCSSQSALLLLLLLLLPYVTATATAGCDVGFFFFSPLLSSPLHLSFS